MNVLFLSQVDINLKSSGLYSDLANCFVSKGHSLTIISCSSSISKKYVEDQSQNIRTIKVKVKNQFGCNVIKKTLILLGLSKKIKHCYKKFLKNERFDLLIYATPPVFFENAIRFIKARNKSKTYLMLKDIFPDNAWDLSVIPHNIIGKIMFSFFKSFEKRLFNVSDFIGCTSNRNIEYILEKNAFLSRDKIGLCFNSIKPSCFQRTFDKTDKIRVMYGGNLGVPQDVPSLLKNIENCECLENIEFIICGKGSEQGLVSDYVKAGHKNLQYYEWLAKDDYDEQLRKCNIGLIFLNHHFSTPNTPSKMLSYMDYEMPIISCCDPNNDLNEIICENQFGWGCVSNDPHCLFNILKSITFSEVEAKGRNAKMFLIKHYNVEKTYEQIMSVFKDSFING